MMDWKTWLKKRLEFHAGIRLYRNSLPRGVDFIYDANQILMPEKVSVVFDVGANVGQSAKWFRRAYPNADIFCFEPVGETFRQLIEQTASLDLVHSFQMALGGTRGSRDIHINLDPDSSVNSFVRCFPGDRQVSVHVETLDAFCQQRGIDHIDLLKIDVEGYELEVLKGASGFLSSGRIKSCYLETSLRGDRKEPFVPLREIDEHLSHFGFSVYGIYEQRWDELRRIDRLYFFNVAYMLDQICVNRRGK